MPILSIYVGESQISVLEYTSGADFKFATYPYVFPYEIYQDGFNSEKFYTQVLRHLGKTEGIDIEADPILLGTVTGVAPAIKHTYNFSVHEALSSVESYSWTLVENFVVMNERNMSSFYPMKKDLTFSQPNMVNYLSNKSLYPHIAPSSPDTFKSEDVLSKNLSASMGASVATEQPMIFTGGRFAHFDENSVASYLLALDLLRTPGVFNVRIDPSNKLPLIGLLNTYLQSNEASDSGQEPADIDEAFEDEFVTLGTVLNSPGGAEILFEMEAGNSQFVDIKPNRLFIFPLEKTSSARIVLEGKSIGHMEKNVRGGSLGFVIDTRDQTASDFLTTSSTQHSEWVKVINERIKAF